MSQPNSTPGSNTADNVDSPPRAAPASLDGGAPLDTDDGGTPTGTGSGANIDGGTP